MAKSKGLLQQCKIRTGHCSDWTYNKDRICPNCRDEIISLRKQLEIVKEQLIKELNINL